MLINVYNDRCIEKVTIIKQTRCDWICYCYMNTINNQASIRANNKGFLKVIQCV